MEILEQRRVMAATISVTVENAVVEERPSDEIVFSLHRDQTDDFLAVRFELDGSASFDTDYRLNAIKRDTLRVPDRSPGEGPVIGTAIFHPGESSVRLEVSPERDDVIEINESVELTVTGIEEFAAINGAAAERVEDEPTRHFLVDQQNRLGVVDLDSGVIDVWGSLDVSETIFDIAYTESGHLFAVSPQRLYRVHLDQADSGSIPVTSLGQHGVIQANALIDSRDGDFGSEEGDLFIVGRGSLDLHQIDLETLDDTVVLAGVQTVFDVDGALASLLLPSDYVSSGDLDYLKSDTLILSARRPGDTFDSLIEIRTPGTGGVIENGPTPAKDFEEDFQGIFGLSSGRDQTFGFAGLTMLSIDRFTRNASRETELTGRPYQIATQASASGTIIGDPVAEPVVRINTVTDDPPDRHVWIQPTSWSEQRSVISELVLDLGYPVQAVSANEITLTNLGRSTNDSSFDVPLSDDQIQLDESGLRVTISFLNTALPAGRYQLVLADTLTSGPSYTLIGDADNRCFVLPGDWDGDAAVTLADFETFVYWYGTTTDEAPRYVDLDGSNVIDEADFQFFRDQLGEIIEFPNGNPQIDPALTDATVLNESYPSVVNPLDVTGNGDVSPLDALNVLNRIALNTADSMPPRFMDWRYDVNRDGVISPRDALNVLNHIASQPSTSARISGGEAEAPSPTPNPSRNAVVVHQDEDFANRTLLSRTLIAASVERDKLDGDEVDRVLVDWSIGT
jgi:hypothetical protein